MDCEGDKMNKHIELVKKWLSDKDSVSSEELKANSNAAYAAYAAAAYAADAAAFYAAADDAAYWVKKYEELTK